MPVAARMRRLRAPLLLDPPGYGRHRPEATLLHRFIDRHGRDTIHNSLAPHEIQAGRVPGRSADCERIVTGR